MRKDRIFVDMPVDRLNQITLKKDYEGLKFHGATLEHYGLFVTRQVFSPSEIDFFRNAFYADLEHGIVQKNPLHLTEYNFGQQSQLMLILGRPAFIELVKNFFCANVGLYNIRVVAKLDSSENSVFLHQDSCYLFGSDQKYSIFIPLTYCSPNNGGLVFVPGSHKFGFMGDAGTLREIYPKDLSLVSPELMVGDVLVMNSHMWHKSAKNITGDPRIFFDIHIMDSRAPFSKSTLLGAEPQEYVIKNYNNDSIFKNSRYQRLRSKN